MSLTDQEYIQRCRNGNHDDFRFLVERYQGPVFAFVASRLHDHTLAAEAAEESLVRAFFSLHKLKNPAAFHAWLLGIAGRVALEFQRTQFRRKEVPTLENQLASPSPNLAQADDDATLDEAIAALPELQRELILMRYFQQLSCQEIADRLRMPLGTVTKTLSRAYAALRELIEARETNPNHLEKIS
jgi:RNA polymerase sigma-70 factor (ECF subfamily)